MNIGVVLGEPSNGLVDIDLDCKEAVALAKQFLPHTDLRFGRESSPESHLVFGIEEPGSSVQFSSSDKGMLLEYRSTGTQTMFPPSIHPEGETVRFDSEGDPAPVRRENLLKSASKLAAACLISKAWIGGSRHEIALALSGWLLRSGCP